MEESAEQIESAIAALQAQRAVLGDAVVAMAVAPLQEKLAALRERDGATQQLKTATVLFMDVVGSTRLSERLDPEDVHAVMDSALERLTAIVHAHHGRVLQYAGDSLLAAFGADQAAEDDAERAVRCAWAMQRAMADFNAESAAQGLPPLVMGIAVHSGAVVAGNIGSQDRMKYGVVGPTVNLAGRIESLTIGPQVLLSEATLARVRRGVTVGAGIQVAVKGVAEPVVVYELLGVTGEAGIDAPDDPGTQAEVDLPAVALVVGEGKRIDETRHPVRVTRIGRDAIELVSSASLPPSSLDLKVIVDFGDGDASDGSYVRIAARESSDRLGLPGALIRAVFTFLNESDRAHIDRLLGAATTPAGAGGPSG